MSKLCHTAALLIFFYFASQSLVVVQGIHPESNLNLEQRIKKHGYPVELHQVTTEDDYMLNLYRVPHGLKKSDNEPRNKSAVLFIHGQGGGPHNFAVLGRKYAAAFYFADRGFDVWLFCSRGVDCQNPRKHKRLDWNKDPEYWDYSLHEIGIYDLAASIDLILNKTEQKNLFIVSYAVGGQPVFALTSEKPQYNDKIKVNANWGAAPILKEVDYPFWQAIAQLSNMLKNLYRVMGLYELFPLYLNDMIGDVLKKMCAEQKWFRACKAFLSCYGSHLSTLIEDDVVELVYSIMHRLSIKQLTHYMDNMNRGDFRKYDHGPKKNVQIYGTKLPPAYNLSAFAAPNAFFYGATDSLSVREDTWETESLLPNTILDYEVGPNFVHLDFILARNASHMVYEPTVKLFKEFAAGNVPPRVVREPKTP